MTGKWERPGRADRENGARMHEPYLLGLSAVDGVGRGWLSQFQILGSAAPDWTCIAYCMYCMYCMYCTIHNMCVKFQS